MSVKPSARSSSSATYRGEKQMLLEMGNRTVVVSGGVSWANDWDKPSRPAAPADDTAVRNRRRLCVMCMRPSLESSARAIAPSLSLELAFELVEETPVGALRDDLAGRRFDHARFVQSQRIEPDRVLGVIVAPACILDFLHRLQRIVVTITFVRDQSGSPLGLGGTELRCLDDCTQRPL